jgi:YspA, cpYpsA-related SLOG family
MRVLVCGGRQFEDCDTLNAELDKLHHERRITLVIAGGARSGHSCRGMGQGCGPAVHRLSGGLGKAREESRADPQSADA